MICADFLAGANLAKRDTDALLFCLTRFFEVLPVEQKQKFLEVVAQFA